MKDGTLIDWRKELGQKLLNIQKANGSWSNETGRWMESDDVLVTSYTLMALARIHQGL
jgi:squalene-hopene/tetraprenyl-beta-curcumene cyclase